VVGLAAKVAEAREQDLVSAADALNRGRKLPQARTPKLEAQHAEAEGDLKLLDKRIELLTAERSEYVADHKDELFSLLEREHTDAGNTVSRPAAQTLEALLQMYRAEDEARQLRRTHPEPQPINYSDPSSTTVILHAPTMGELQGQRRGDIEGTLRLLQSYGQATEIGAVPEDEPAAVHEGGGG
jgi:hypothetical protein